MMVCQVFTKIGNFIENRQIFILLNCNCSKLAKFEDFSTCLGAVVTWTKCIIIFVNSAVSAVTSFPKQPPPLPRPSVTPNSVTVIIFKFYNRPKSQITGLRQTRTVSHVLLSKLEYQLLSLTSSSLHIYITSSLFKVIAALALRLWLLALPPTSSRYE